MMLVNMMSLPFCVDVGVVFVVGGSVSRPRSRGVYDDIKFL